MLPISKHSAVPLDQATNLVKLLQLLTDWKYEGWDESPGFDKLFVMLTFPPRTFISACNAACYNTVVSDAFNAVFVMEWPFWSMKNSLILVWIHCCALVECFIYTETPADSCNQKLCTQHQMTCRSVSMQHVSCWDILQQLRYQTWQTWLRNWR